MEPLNTKILFKILSAEEADNSNLIITNWSLDQKIVNAGANIGSNIKRLTIRYTKNGTELCKKYIFKEPYTAPLYELCSQMGVYQKEYLVYTEILPDISLNSNESIAPLHLYTGNQYCLILEDLSQKGYTVCDRSLQLDLEHCKLVFTTLAKFHATSVRLERDKKIPDIVKKSTFGQIDTSRQYDYTFKLFSSGFDVFVENLKHPYKEKLIRLRNTFGVSLENATKPLEDSFNVLNHGDLWSANIMFKYNERDGTVEKIKFLDFQCCYWTNPVLDILRFTATSMRFDVYKENFDELLEIYLETLNGTLKHFQCDTYEMRDLRKDIAERTVFLFYSVLNILPMTLTKFTESDTARIDEALRNEEAALKMNKKIIDDAHVQEVTMKWFDYFVKTGK